MRLKDEFSAARLRWAPMTLYEKFEHASILVLTGLIAVVIVASIWNLAIKILVDVVLTSGFDPSDYAAFQAIFGMIFTVIIALEFKRSLLVFADRVGTVVQVRTVILIAMLAIVRKVIILDIATAPVGELFGLAAAILALGVVYWLVRDQDRRARREPPVEP
jgi:uncharacterized membrane protein (DUF373 family)